MKHVLATTILAGALCATPAMAQTGQSGQSQPPPHTTTKAKQTPRTTGTSGRAAATRATGGTLAPSDRTFVTEAAEGGMAEVELGNLAKDKASSADVKQFADRIVTDHSKANDELKAWAQQKGVTLPTELDAKHKATRDRLSKLSGDAFDKAYMHEMVTDHQTDLSAFKRESSAANDADLKAWAAQTVPALQDHLKMARETAAKVGAHTGPAKKPGTMKRK